MTYIYRRPTVSHHHNQPSSFWWCGVDRFGLRSLLLRWRGSIFKLLWPDYFIFLGCYFILSLLYRYFLSPSSQATFIQLTKYCDKYGNLIPVSFVLGFYVSIIVRRWWEQVQAIPWIDSLALILSTAMPGVGEPERVYRRTIVRHACLAITQCFILICPRVKRRFPTNQHLINAGLLLEHEKSILEETIYNTNNNSSSPCIDLSKYPNYWIPLAWACTNVANARAQNSLRADAFIKPVFDEINQIKNKCALLISYDWISIPLVYTQVVTLAVYTYFLSCLLSRQWLPSPGSVMSTVGSTMNISSTNQRIIHPMPLTSDDVHIKSNPGSGNPLEQLDLIFPFFTTLQFFFYMGWLKVAESLLNPFGDDEDDIELNWIIDRNIQVGYVIVDQMLFNHPKLVKDTNWDKIVPEFIPHTISSWKYYEEPPENATTKFFVSNSEGELYTNHNAKLRSRAEEHSLYEMYNEATSVKKQSRSIGSRVHGWITKHWPHRGGGGGGGRTRNHSYSSASSKDEHLLNEVSTNLINSAGKCAIVPIEVASPVKKRNTSIDSGGTGGSSGAGERRSILSTIPMIDDDNFETVVQLA